MSLLFLVLCSLLLSLLKYNILTEKYTDHTKCTSKQNPDSPTASPSHQEASTSLLSLSIRGQTENHNHRKLTKLITWITTLSNSMKLWAMLCSVTQDRRVMVESFDKMWSTGEGNGKTLQYYCLKNPMNSMKREKNITLKDELPRLVGAQYATREEWRNNSRKYEETEPKWKQHPVVDMTGDGSKVQCYKNNIS